MSATKLLVYLRLARLPTHQDDVPTLGPHPTTIAVTKRGAKTLYGSRTLPSSRIDRCISIHTVPAWTVAAVPTKGSYGDGKPSR